MFETIDIENLIIYKIETDYIFFIYEQREIANKAYLSRHFFKTEMLAEVRRNRKLEFFTKTSKNQNYPIF